MAYLFSKLNSLMGSKPARQSDVLNAPQDDVETNTALQTSRASNVISGGAQSNAPNPAAAPDQYTRVSSEARGKVLSKNHGQSVAPKAVDDVASGVAQAKSQLQSEADKFKSEGAYKTFDRGQLEKALDSNDESARSAVSGALNAQYLPKDFGYDNSAITNLEDQAKAFSTRGGLQSALKAQSGGEYTSGEAALDATLMRRAGTAGKARQQLAENLASFRSDLGSAVQGTKDFSMQQAKALDDDKAALRESLRGRAGSISADVDKALEFRNAALSQGREFSRSKEGERVRAEAQAALRDLDATEKGLNTAGQYADWRPEYDKASVAAQRKALQDMVANPGKYLTQAQDAYTREDVTSEDQAGDFNWLQELLGSPDRLSRAERNLDVGASRGGSVDSQIGGTRELLAKLNGLLERKRQSDAIAPNQPGQDKSASERAMDAMNLPTPGRPVPQIVDRPAEQLNAGSAAAAKGSDKATQGGGSGRPTGKTEAPKAPTPSSAVKAAQKAAAPKQVAKTATEAPKKTAEKAKDTAKKLFRRK